MSVLQSQYNELRYLKRKGLEEESRIIGNALRDQIRQYGVDCVYYKLNTDNFIDFKNIIDQNTILRKAYGYEITPDYTLSAPMIVYAEVQTDIFQLNKYGYNPNVEVDFYFDRIDFACALATKCGRYKEYKIDKKEIVTIIPNITNEYVEYNGQKQYLSAHEFPYELGVFGDSPIYTCENLSGYFRAIIHPYEYDKEYTILCDPYEHTQFNVEFPVNKDLYRSLKYKIENDDYLETLIYLTYKVIKENNGDNTYKSVLSGYIHGSVLFYDINHLGKYVDLIHPSVGDIIEIDFPDDKNREKYEITDCFDKQLTQDGINPLLHKYIWKCKGRRYTNSYEENTPQTEGDNRVEEMQKYNTVTTDEVTDSISMYDTIDGDVKEDAVYGGYDGVITEYDIMKPNPYNDKYDYIDDGTAIDLIRFDCGSRLITNGYDLMFMPAKSIENGDACCYKIAMTSAELPGKSCLVEQKMKWLKATDSQIVFININGEVTQLICDMCATNNNLNICLNSLTEKTLNDGKSLNNNNQNFYKFSGTKTYMWATPYNLFAKLQSNKQLYQIV